MSGPITSDGRLPETVHRAAWVVVDPRMVLENGWVHTAGGIIRSIGSGRCPGIGRVRDHGEGILFPLPVNAHVHLELCALHRRVPTENGFLAWVQHLIRERSAVQENLMAGAEEGMRDMISGLCGAAAEVSTLGITRDLFLGSGIAGIWFQEYLGDSAGILEIDAGPLFSLAGHGPHTTSPGLLRELKGWTRRTGFPFSIHAAESEEEFRFVTQTVSPWHEFLLSRGIETKTWNLPASSPVIHLAENGILDCQTLLIHMLETNDHDLDTVKRFGSHVCLCPRSNWALHRRIPNVPAMMKRGIPLCLGTDSLASVDSLCVMDETAFLSEQVPGVDVRDIFAMATIGGARALGLSGRLGTLHPEKSVLMGFLPARAGSVNEVMSWLVQSGRESRRIVDAGMGTFHVA